MQVTNPFAAPESTVLSTPPGLPDLHPTFLLFRRLFWAWLIVTLVMVIVIIVREAIAADVPADANEKSTEAEAASDDLPVAALMMLVGVASIWTSIRLYRLRRAANVHALLVTLACFMLAFLDPAESQPEPGWLAFLISCSEMAWGGLLALSFAEPLRSRCLGMAQPSTE